MAFCADALNNPPHFTGDDRNHAERDAKSLFRRAATALEAMAYFPDKYSAPRMFNRQVQCRSLILRPAGGGRAPFPYYGTPLEKRHYEAPESIEATFQIPGVNQKRINVNVENRLLTMSGEPPRRARTAPARRR